MHAVQVVEGKTLATSKSYRDVDGVKYAAPPFVAALRAGIKGRENVYTPHDVAYVDFICAAKLLDYNLQKMSAKGTPAQFAAFSAEAHEHVGKEVTTDGRVLFKIQAPDRYACAAFLVLVLLRH